MSFALENIEDEAKAFVKQYLQAPRVIAFYAPMGAGKTTFIRALCRVLQVTDTVNSPTFAIVNEYSTAQEEALYHFDFYRIKSIDEALDFGTEEYLYSQSTCLIEWPELIEPLLPEDVLKVEIKLLENDQRELEVKMGK